MSAKTKFFSDWNIVDMRRYFGHIAKCRGHADLSTSVYAGMANMPATKRRVGITGEIAGAIIEAYELFQEDTRVHVWQYPLRKYFDQVNKVTWTYAEWYEMFSLTIKHLREYNLIEDNNIILSDKTIVACIEKMFKPHERKKFNSVLFSEFRQGFLWWLEHNELGAYWKMYVSVDRHHILPKDDAAFLLAHYPNAAQTFKLVQKFPVKKALKPAAGGDSLSGLQEFLPLTHEARTPPDIAPTTQTDVTKESSQRQPSIDAITISAIKVLGDKLVEALKGFGKAPMTYAVQPTAVTFAFKGFIPLTKINVSQAVVKVVESKAVDDEHIKSLVRGEIEKIFGSIEPKEIVSPAPEAKVPHTPAPVARKVTAVKKVKVEEPKKINLMILGFKPTQLQALQDGLPKHVKLESHFDFDSAARKRIGQVDYIYITRFGGHTRMEAIKALGLKNYEYVSGGVSSVRASIHSYIESKAHVAVE